MSIVFIMPDRNSRDAAEALRRLSSVRVHETVDELSQQERSQVRMAVLWNPPDHWSDQFPNLEAALSYGAGAEFLVNDHHLSDSVYRGRLVDTHLKHQMARYLLAVVLSTEARLDDYRTAQHEQRWQPLEPEIVQSIGLLGYGQLSRFTGQQFEQLGYRVHYWRRTETAEDQQIYSGRAGLRTMASRSDALICLLPLTEATRGILNQDLFDHCKSGCHLINVGRGGQLNTADLIEALDNGCIAKATLDVFEPEPLPLDSPLWSHSCVHITPHIASKTDPTSAALRIFENYRSLESGQGLLDPVDCTRGY